MELPRSVQPSFVAAGWQRIRRVPVNANVPVQHAAYAILAQMGGLHVGQCGSGIECATSNLEFQYCEVDAEIVDTWGSLLGYAIFGVAQVHNQHGWLLVDEVGRCFGASQIHDAFYFEGATFGEAVERLLFGRKARPMLRPDQEQIELYGDTFVRGHPAIFAVLS